MSKFEQTIETFKKSFQDKLKRTDYDETLLRAIAKSLGPSIYENDFSKVACSDKKELDEVKTTFLIGKLGLIDSPELDDAIKEVCATMGSANRNKYRVVFYYLLVEKFEKRAIFVMKEKAKSEKKKKIAEEPVVHDALSDEIIDNYALYAAGAGLIPIPIIDLVSISAVQYKMIKKLASNYPHVVFNENKTKSVLAAIVGGMGSLELGIFTRILFKSVPFFGPIIGGTAVSGFAYFSTKSIGQIFDDHFASGGDLSISELSIQKMKDTFNFKIKKSKVPS